MQLADLDPHLHAQRRIEVGERLVEQERLGLAHDRAADGDALALAAGELARLAVEIIGQVQGRGRLAHLLLDHVLALCPAILSAKAMLSRTLMCG